MSRADEISAKLQVALDFKKRREFNAAGRIFEQLASQLDQKGGRPVDVLKLRDHNGTCKFESGLYAAAEAYQRETLRRWRRLRNAEPRHVAHTSHELAKTLIKRSEECDNLAMVEESIELLQVKLDFLNSQQFVDTRQRLIVLKHLLLAFTILEYGTDLSRIGGEILQETVKLYHCEPEHHEIIIAHIQYAQILAKHGAIAETKTIYQKSLRLLRSREKTGFSEWMTEDEYAGFSRECTEAIAILRWRQIGMVTLFLGKLMLANKLRRWQSHQLALSKWNRAITVVVFVERCRVAARLRHIWNRGWWTKAINVALAIAKFAIIAKNHQIDGYESAHSFMDVNEDEVGGSLFDAQDAERLATNFLLLDAARLPNAKIMLKLLHLFQDALPHLYLFGSFESSRY
jgi:tetratricopeptide (TPR) repeat protein